jgi:hypothetical protein
MGFDLHGLSPQGITNFVEPDWSDKEQVAEYHELKNTIKGAYFRNSVWYWRPLWNLVCAICDDVLTEKDRKSGEYNDGHTISAEKSWEMHKRLKDGVKSGELESVIEHHETLSKTMEDEPCDICKGTGTRKGWEGWRSENQWLKYHESLNNTDTEPKVSYKHAHDCKGCNACKGKGSCRPFLTHYKLTLKNVEEFMEFCKDSGGFRIW